MSHGEVVNGTCIGSTFVLYFKSRWSIAGDVSLHLEFGGNKGSRSDLQFPCPHDTAVGDRTYHQESCHSARLPFLPSSG